MISFTLIKLPIILNILSDNSFYLLQKCIPFIHKVYKIQFHHMDILNNQPISYEILLV